MAKNKRIVLISLLIVTCLVATLVFSACDLSFLFTKVVATFDTRHVVYEGDTLDSLRPYLTVKYIEGENVTELGDNNYELSGTLRVGTSIISVHYKNLTRNVSIPVKAGTGGDNGGGGNNQGDDEVNIVVTSSSYSVVAGSSAYLTATTEPAEYASQVTFEIVQGAEYGEIDGNVFTAVAAGQCAIVGKVGESISEQIVITVTKKSSLNVTIVLSLNKTFIEKNNYVDMTLTVTPSSYESQVSYRFLEGEDCVTRYGRSLMADKSGTVKVQAYIEDCVSNIASFQIVDPDEDPYQNVNSTSFYNNYNVATSLEDSYWRTQHNLMSGSIADQDQAPTVASNQPKSGNKLVRNSAECYTDNGNTWEVMDTNGNVVNKIYKFGAYVTLEEVAAYVYAFGDVPANYIASNDTSKLNGNAWGKYLRLNHTYFSGDTSKYPYEPLLPRISGEGGDLDYYEIDIGTTGTDCDPKYEALPYNTGSKITRGAARIVYTKDYEAGGHIDDLKDRYVFYTYNHYNDFQEYLNYQGGWGYIFGNVTGGGTISSKSNYNPTPYVEVVRQNFSTLSNLVG